MLGHYRPASETPLKWRVAGRRMMAHLEWYLNPLSPYQLKKTVDLVKVKPTLKKLSGSAHVTRVSNITMLTYRITITHHVRRSPYNFQLKPRVVQPS